MQCALRYFALPVVLTTGLLLLGGPRCRAQDLAPAKSLANMDAQADQIPPYKSITLKQKYIYSLEQMFSGPSMITILAHTGIDQAMDNPHAWGSNAPSFGIRAASLFGRSFVRATIGSGIRGLDHEDPRYFYSHKADNWDRTKYAIVHTFKVYNDDGSMMPAYSRFIGTFGMPFLAETWHPGGFNAPTALRSGGIGIGLGVGMTIAQEFWPDVKHALHLGPGVSGLITPGTVH
ncbi:MAG: hypothetical protein ABSF22_03030 [Bryobacteraceae bacterium]